MTDLINNATTEGELIEYLATGFEALLDKVDALLSSNAELGKQIRELQTPVSIWPVLQFHFSSRL